MKATNVENKFMAERQAIKNQGKSIRFYGGLVLLASACSLHHGQTAFGVSAELTRFAMEPQGDE